MAIIKNGDLQPVISYYDNDGQEEKCSKCGNALVVVAINGHDNKLVCEVCDTEETE